MAEFVRCYFCGQPVGPLPGAGGGRYTECAPEDLGWAQWTSGEDSLWACPACTEARGMVDIDYWNDEDWGRDDEPTV